MDDKIWVSQKKVKLNIALPDITICKKNRYFPEVLTQHQLLITILEMPLLPATGN